MGMGQQIHELSHKVQQGNIKRIKLQVVSPFPIKYKIFGHTSILHWADLVKYCWNKPNTVNKDLLIWLMLLWKAENGSSVQYIIHTEVQQKLDIANQFSQGPTD